ncbi:glycosyltransferase [Mucilaginibacter sp. RS28]|uniref:Glycosyltransferase n=1 Tax=Mucilaginibacter straminoryzae TaxID=2932774 RepID=A0A9X1X4S6_9SPHI|nr:glycosyltransferase [Mucilaginibacter straminoryzae]MCJ8211029.1 glycosyltransferase [Mucilaginibacter straminoryzae]
MADQSTVLAVFCYKRASKLKRCIDALLTNPECADMDIIFFSDGYKNEKDRAGVLETRDYINSITGFRNVIKHFRDRNFSTGPNFRTGLTYLAENYEQFIVVEDDLIVAPNYVKYLLDALKFYKNDQSVFCCTGFVYPVTPEAFNYQYDSIVYQRFCSYGWGGWADRFKNVVWDEQELQQMMDTRPGFKARLNAEGYDLGRMLKKQINGDISTWDIQLQVHVAENHLKVIYPILSKVNNIGFDEESTNTFGVNWMETPFDEGKQRSFKFCPPDLIVKPLQKQIKKPFSLPELVKRKLINEFIKATRQVKKAS